jgi:hypothetical protein
MKPGRIHTIQPQAEALYSIFFADDDVIKEFEGRERDWHIATVSQLLATILPDDPEADEIGARFLATYVNVGEYEAYRDLGRTLAMKGFCVYDGYEWFEVYEPGHEECDLTVLARSQFRDAHQALQTLADMAVNYTGELEGVDNMDQAFQHSYLILQEVLTAATQVAYEYVSRYTEGSAPGLLKALPHGEFSVMIEWLAKALGIFDDNSKS